MPDVSYTVTTLASDSIADVAFSADQSKLYAATASGDVETFDVATHALLSTWQIGSALGAITVSDDGSFLLVSDPRQPLLYRVSTADGSITGTYLGSGNAFSDVQLLDNQTALVTGGAGVETLDLATGSFASVANASEYSGNAIITRDGDLSLLAETGISDGPLHIYDGVTGQVTASASDYETPNSGFNFGVQAVSEAAGLVLQFIYYSTINIYDTSLHYLRSINLGDTISGLAFADSGRSVLVKFETGSIVKYDATTFNVIATYSEGQGSTTNSSVEDYGNTLLDAADGRHIAVLDAPGYPSAGGNLKLIDLTVGDEVLHVTGVETIAGGGGNDTFYGTRADLQGSTITDLNAGDRIHITDATLAGFSFAFNQSDNEITFSGFIHLPDGIAGEHFTATADPAGGVDLLLVHDTATADFNGDGRSDVLFRNDDGSLSTWHFTGDGTDDTVQQNTYFASVPTSWHAQEIFDMNGDGLSDILWRNDDGAVSVWTGTGDGFVQGALTYDGVATSWKIAAVGDMNGDGKDDILFRNDDGALSIWTATTDGTGFFQNSYFHDTVGTEWKVAGMGDFNGDGKDDILFRNDDGSVSIWTATTVRTSAVSQSPAGSSSFVPYPQYAPSYAENTFSQGVGNQWHIAGIGDFDGDGKADILWRNDNGDLTVWQSNGSNFTEDTRDASVSTDWHVVQVGDFNGDGLSDILFRNDNGALSTWHSDGTNFVQDTFYDTSVPTSWHVDAHHFGADAFLG